MRTRRTAAVAAVTTKGNRVAAPSEATHALKNAAGCADRLEPLANVATCAVEKKSVTCAVYDTKPYDREYFTRGANAEQVAWRFHAFRLSAETAATAKGAEAVCLFVNDRVDRGCLEALAAVGVKLVALRCAGCNNVDLDAAKTLGLAVVRVPAYSPHAVAEHAVGLVLTLNRKIHRAFNRVREHNFSLSGLIGFDVHGKTVGIVGTGKIGRIVAQIFRGFGADVIAHDPFPSPEWAVANGVRYASLDSLLAASDIISLHLPLLPGTHHLLNAQTLSRTKPGVFIVNTSRGKLIDTRALIAALKGGEVGGVALDVYEDEAGVFFEDLSGQVLHDDQLARLLTFPNVLVTAHQAFLTHEALSEIARVTTANLLKLGAGNPLLEGTVL
jgi:D-lactate dehydrogenase